MMQELLGGGFVEDSKISASSGLLGAATNVGPSSCSPTSSAAAAAAAVSPTAANSEQPNLRCPRCDSTNTKFCYYNNYNLTQPRHFCKTCRRYWTKGGALRNVPIGGGCRKAKAAAGISVIGVGKPGGNTGSKAKILASDLLVGKPGFGGLGLGGAVAGFDHELPSNHPMLWASSPQNSHLLNLLRAAQRSGMSNAANNTSNLTAMISNPNPNPSRSMDPNPMIRIKEEGPMLGSHLVPEASLLRNALNARNMAVDPFVDQLPLGLSSSLWSNQYQYQQQLQLAQQHGLQLPDHGAPSSAIQELYQRLRPSAGSTTAGYADQYQAVFLSNVGSSPPSSSSCSVSLSNASSTAAAAAASTANMILEPAAAVAGGELGYWSSPPFAAWADMPTSHGAFP